MIILSFNDLTSLNHYVYDRFVDDSNTHIIPFDMYCAYVIKNELYNSLRSHIDSGQPYSEFKNTISQLGVDPSTNLDVVSIFETYSPIGSSNVYLFPYSKKDFVSTYFPNLTPSYSSALYDLMKSTGRLVQIGGGSGKAIVLRLSPMTQSHFDSLPNMTDPYTLLNTIDSTVSSLRTAIVDTEYYISEINKRDKIIEILNLEIETLNSKISQAYQTTWR